MKEHTFQEYCNRVRQLEKRVKALEQPSENMVSRGVFEQVMWERDVALNQLKELGYRLGEKPKTGHWINDKCSICGKGIEDLIDSREWYRNEHPNFCPFCGAKMVEPQERGKE